MGEHGNGGGRSGEADRGEEGLHGLHSVGKGMTVLDAMHLAMEGGNNAGVEAVNAAAHYGEELGEFAETGAGAVSTTASAIASPLSFAGGLVEMIAAFQDPHGERAAPTALAGAATSTSGALGLAGLAGSEAAGALAPVVGAGALGVKAGMYADEDVKKRGWLKDREGKATTIHDWAAEAGQATDEFFGDGESEVSWVAPSPCWPHSPAPPSHSTILRSTQERVCLLASIRST